MKTLILALAIATIAQSAAAAQTPAASPNPSGSMQGGGAVTLVPAGKKGPAGSAVLSQQGANLLVTLHLPQGYTPSGKAMVASGTCNSSGAAAMAKTGKTYNLMVSASDSGTSTSGGVMTTLENVSLESLTSSPHIIVVQGTPALCGDVTNLLPPQKP
jgi:hypothetical protein